MLQIGDIVKWTDGIDTFDTYGFVLAEKDGYYTVMWLDDGTFNTYPAHNLINPAKVV